jgi:hypothetical protein
MSEWKSFAFVIDGEVAEVVAFPVEAEKIIAVYESNPIIVPVTPETQDGLFGEVLGSTWNGTQFIR